MQIGCVQAIPRLTFGATRGVLRAVFFCRISAALRARPLLIALCLALCVLCVRATRARAQDSSAWSPEGLTAQGITPEETGQWFLGAYYRHAWIPKLMLKPVFERASSISNEGLGVTLSHWSRGGVTMQVGLGYQGYHFQGAFNPNDSLIEDTEYVTSKLGLVHLTGSILWPITLHRMWTLELGLGVDLGIVTGSMHRTEAYPKNGAFVPCESALQPDITGPNDDVRGMPTAYCEQPYDRNGKPIATSGASISGGHYNDRESRVPPLMLVPMLPHFTLRFEPVERVALKLEAAFGLAQLWVGASIHVGFGRKRSRAALTAEPEAAHAPEVTRVPAAPALKLGRVIGKLMENGTGKPIAHASVKNRRMYSAIQTDGAGLFVFENVEPGALRLEVTQPDYEAGSCEVTVPPEGGDVNLHCFLRPARAESAISGHVKDQDGKPVPAARIEISGPTVALTQSDINGLFAFLDAPVGTYRLRVQAPGYLTQIVELELGPRETALPQIILLRNDSQREAKP